MAKTRYKGEIVDILRVGEDGFVRAKILLARRELGVLGYVIRYEDNNRVAFLPMDSIVEIQLAHQKKAPLLKFPRLRAVKNKQ